MYTAYSKILLFLSTNFNLNQFQIMARAMFEYTKTVLDKVSFDANLFCKEVKKAIQRLLPHEIEELRLWIISLTRQNPELNVCLIYLNT